MSPTLNLSSSRAMQARFGHRLQPPVLRAGLVLLSLFLLAIAAWLWQAHSSLTWFIAGFAAWPLLPVVWYQWWLKRLPAPKNSSTIDDLLDPSVLGVVRPNPSPKQLAELVMHTNGGLFFAVRLGIGPNFLRELSSDDPADTIDIWKAALRIRTEVNTPDISSAVLTAALVSQLPGRDKALAQLQLTFADVEAGVGWYHHFQQLIDLSKLRQLGGGLGRDLSFGYTPMLTRFARNISNEVGTVPAARELEGHTQLVSQLLQQLSQGNHQNAVIVGKNGVGKTTIVYSLADHLLRDDSSVPSNLRYQQIMMLDPAVLISQARGRGELEGLLNDLIFEAAHARNIILFFDNAELFFEEGTGSIDVRNVLLPAIESGTIRIILSMDEQQWLKLSRATPALAQQLNPITIAPLGEADTLLVCEDQLLAYEFSHKVTYMYQSLKAVYRLAARYVADQAMPGQALHILEAAARHAEDGLVTAASIERAVEQVAGVRVANARQGEERDMLLNMEALIHQRMINQTHAVTEVANALRRARSGVRNQNRPIGSFLFLGPTGVGKTELAKALAAVYFGGEDHIVRLDLNEFGQPTDVARLIADGAKDPRSLTAQIAKQPFSVVLLDEIEKAHPTVLDTLLQLLDEGILRDTNNRDISFRDAIIIATSNAGADRIRQYIAAGYKLDQFEEKFTNELIDAGIFKPEFLNRFDEITVFRPLTEDELLQVVDLMLGGVNATLSQQQIQVQVADDAKRLLVQRGNDPRLGARPLRRMVQRTVENIVATQLLRQQIEPGQTITISLADIEQALQK